VGASPCFQAAASREDSQEEVVVVEEEGHPSQAWAAEEVVGEAWSCVDFGAVQFVTASNKPAIRRGGDGY
jgi:hypothetical protein